MRTGTFFGPAGLKLVITTTDPDTPAMVYLKKSSATFDCALGTGMVDDTEDLTRAQSDWLEGYEDDVADAYDKARAGMPQYQ